MLLNKECGKVLDVIFNWDPRLLVPDERYIERLRLSLVDADGAAGPNKMASNSSDAPVHMVSLCEESGDDKTRRMAQIANKYVMLRSVAGHCVAR